MSKTLMVWTFIFSFVACAVIMFAYKGVVQNAAVQTTADIEILNPNINVGNARVYANETDDYQYFQKEQVITELISEMSEAQVSHNHDVRMSYVFIDDDGNETRDEVNARGIHFLFEYINNEGKIVGSSERRIMYDTIDVN